MFQNKYFCYVDSKKRISGTDSNFVYNVGLTDEYQHIVDRVVILDAIIPKSYYLVQENFNSFILTENSTSITIYFPIGCYILSAFASTLQTLLNENSPNGFSYNVISPLSNITTSSNLGKWTINVTGNGIIQPSITVSEFFYEPFGFEANSTNYFVSNTLVSSNVVKLQSEDRVLLCSDVCTSTGSGDIGILQAIDGQSQPDFTTINYQCSQVDANSKYFISKGSTFKFLLTNEEGQELKTNGLNLTFTLLFYKENPIYDVVNKFIQVLYDSNK